MAWAMLRKLRCFFRRINMKMPGKTGFRRVDYQARRLPGTNHSDENSGGLVRLSLSYLQVALRADSDAITCRYLNALFIGFKDCLAQPLLSYR